jgi:hypothetical protein
MTPTSENQLRASAHRWDNRRHAASDASAGGVIRGGSVGNPIDPVKEREQQGRRSQLPDWMRDPPPPKATLGRRLEALSTRVGVLRRTRERWWAWRGRRRLGDRYPKTVKIVAFFLAWGISLGLIMAAYGCYGAA